MCNNMYSVPFKVKELWFTFSKEIEDYFYYIDKKIVTFRKQHKKNLNNNRYK